MFYRYIGICNCRSRSVKLRFESLECRRACTDPERHGQGEEHGRYRTCTGGAVTFADDQVIKTIYLGMTLFFFFCYKISGYGQIIYEPNGLTCTTIFAKILTSSLDSYCLVATIFLL